ncbi:DUF3365 domain-containing protein [Algivirga pacifica]|uniref:Tll0287-like domain-containing protein n=1 Tax=Algivirga pacifica TaxID=1162670 RepID=A0ABP9DFD2_9BACT
MKTTILLILLSAFLISCNQKESSKEEKTELEVVAEMAPLALGNTIAMETQTVLAQNLMKAIKTKGTVHALAFCSEQAIPLTDSVAQSLHAYIKRVSDKNRNPKNKANATELAYINASKEALAKGQSIEPKLITTENSVVGYYPIVTNSMCLQCHGQPEKDIEMASLSKIQQLYPEDKATGYKAGELRGIWVIEMDKK